MSLDKVHPFFICTSSRSGSLLFNSLVNSTKLLEPLDEHFHYARGVIKTDKELLDYIENIGIDKSKIWGSKVDVRDLPVVKHYLSIHGNPFSDIRWIWLRRKDKIRQAISYCKVRRTHTEMIAKDADEEGKRLATSDMEIPVEEIGIFALQYCFIDAAWDKFFRENSIKPYMLFYEDFIDESTWESLVTGFFDFLGVPYSLPLKVDTDMLRQSTDDVPMSYEECLDYLHSWYSERSYARGFWL